MLFNKGKYNKEKEVKKNIRIIIIIIYSMSCKV